MDPTNRVWMSAMRSYIPPVELNAVMRGAGAGQVVASKREDLPAGAYVVGLTGWQDYCVADAASADMLCRPRKLWSMAWRMRDTLSIVVSRVRTEGKSSLKSSNPRDHALRAEFMHHGPQRVCSKLAGICGAPASESIPRALDVDDVSDQRKPGRSRAGPAGRPRAAVA
ncbi:hypothetical protein NLM24_31735 [Nocardia zapadnayensis]|uniref:hypothetical protein n=1 Tax=Nocardia rhamnosiphila TaxID=426716 RepID=UPI002245B334|nr:hypothetical protein [Nocardia zapadnayensis]MCX0275179.1 hypothetical protein [Nocardia zapadnayensis]